MGDKYQPEVQGYPLAPATVVPRSDEEYGRNSDRTDEEMKKKKRIKCFAYIAIFAVFQVAVILIFSLTVMRVKTPKVRLDNVAMSAGGADIKFSARVLVKNTNFGHYKFDSTLATIKSAGGESLGQFSIQEARAKARSTKKITVEADLSASNNNSGTLDLIMEAKLRGKVTLMKVMKKKKTADMYCTLTLVLSSNTVQNLRCK